MPHKLPLDSSVEAEYEDGYVHSETERDDQPLFGEGNVFTDIYSKKLEADHGPMVRFSVFWQNNRYDIDWRQVPDDSRPIRFRHGYNHYNPASGESVSGWSGVDFGFQWNDEEGNNLQEIVNL